MLTADEVALIRGQFYSMEPFSDTIGSEFLARVFWATPEARAYFPRDIFEAHRDVFDLICFAVEHLERVDDVVLAFEALMSRTALTLPTPTVEAAIRAALLGTLANRLDGAFSDPARSAWSRAFAMVADCARSRLPTQPVRKAA